MKTIPIENQALDEVITALSKSELFGSLNQKSLSKIAGVGKLLVYEPNETIMHVKDPPDAVYTVIKGQVAVFHHFEPGEEKIELARLKPHCLIGEIGVLLGESRSATVKACVETRILKLDAGVFDHLFDHMPGFGRSICRNLAARVKQLSERISLPPPIKDMDLPDQDLIQLLPMDFIVRHHVLPLRIEDNSLWMGFIHDPKPGILKAAQRFAPSMELKPVQIDQDLFDKMLKSHAGNCETAEFEKKDQSRESQQDGIDFGAQLNFLLKRMVAEGASDLHLCAGQYPHWRIDGEILEIEDSLKLGPEDVLKNLAPLMNESSLKEFRETNDTDFAYSMGEHARFRVNLFRDNQGTSAVFRVIPAKPFTIKQLGLPDVIEKLCNLSQGLILVSGPTGSGKSTTLAAMIDYINQHRRAHIITIEDPIEFVHTKKTALINQRQVGYHTKSFTNAIRSALRQDPDVILVGELRDTETVALAIESANTGNLVFGTLHSPSAVRAISHVLEFFPHGQQQQVLNSLSECLKGVIAMALCRKVLSGRKAAVEVLVVNSVMSSIMVQGKMNQIVSAMQTGKAQGNQLLDNELAKLVRQGEVEYREALRKSPDPKNFAKLMGKSM